MNERMALAARAAEQRQALCRLLPLLRVPLQVAGRIGGQIDRFRKSAL